MINFSGVSKYFNNVPAVDEISFQANEREILVLLGPSGCGKTTTLKMINRLIDPDKGCISIDGQDIKNQKPEELRRGIGFVMHHAGLFPHYSVEKNIAVVPTLLNWEEKKIRTRTMELMEQLHLPEQLLMRLPQELSGGQQQRVGIARALIANTPILLMDEPFGALDNITKADIHSEFKLLDELKNKTIILVTHDVQEAFELGHRICLIDKGKVIQIGKPKEILYHPVNDFARDFFASNRLLLEHKIATLKDLAPFLNVNEQAGDNKLSEDTSVWDALQLFSAQKIGNEKYDAISNAFNEYRKQQLS